MLRILTASLCFAVTSGALATDAPEDAALMIRVQGEVLVLSSGAEPVAAKPMLRVAAGDRLQLPGGASVQLVFYQTGIQETWSGSGHLAVERTRGLSDTLQVSKRELPALMAAQLLKIPESAHQSKAGMVRLRSLKDIEKILQIEANYEEYRKASAPDDTAPAIYFISGMLELKQYDRVVEFLDVLERDYPEDSSFQELIVHFKPLVTPVPSSQPDGAEVQ